jgi:exosortase
MSDSEVRTGEARLPLQAPIVLGALLFTWLFWEPMVTLLRDWWNDPEAAHGLLLGPLALYLAYRAGLSERRRPQRVLGVVILCGAVVLRIVSGLAAELFTMRMSLIGAALGLVVFAWGLPQVRRWWLSIALLVLAVPIPAVILSTLALPLQLRASAFGAALLKWRDVPVLLSGNVINLPGRSLFVAEACSGLRSLTALLSLGVLMGGIWLRSPVLRVLLLAVSIPVGMFINGIRVFLTGFLVFFVNPEAGDGFMHLTEGWAMFVVAFGILGGVTWLLVKAEWGLRVLKGRTHAAASAEG